MAVSKAIQYAGSSEHAVNLVMVCEEPFLSRLMNAILR